jgi:ABC-type nitrate/sulfonate/bicarbonate transport system ATPase subunit
MTLSSKFILTNNDNFQIVNIPYIKNDLPIISCIGTSRDGKSTLLNIYAEWLYKKKNIISMYNLVSNKKIIILSFMC